MDPDTKRLVDKEITAELARYESARDKVSSELRNLQRKVEKQVGPEEAAIFQTHRSILRDTAFTKKVRQWIVKDRIQAQAALQKLLDDYAAMFGATADDYIRERLADVRDVVVRLSAHLSDVLRPEVAPPLDGPLIICVDELLPSQAVALGDTEVRGIVTQRGSQTSHAAIIARSRGIPAVSGVVGVLKNVKTGDVIVVDGREGHVIVNPDAEALAAYRKLEREFFHLRDQLAENRDQPAITKDGEPLRLLANINHAQDALAAGAMGASGVGLYRTEYLYLTHEDVPDEEEQLAAYRDIIDASPDHNVTIRTLDIGGDKTIPYLGRHQEANPFMGWRSIRLSFEHPEFFETQVRAILRAASYAEKLGGGVKLMFPMITTLEEMRRVRSFVRRAGRKLGTEGKSFSEVPVGLMLEVPAAAVAIDLMLDVVDFVSIGSNDLVQYLMAADRDNPKVSHLCQPLSPPVLRVLGGVIRACNKAGKPVTLCGEMAGQPRAFVLLMGMGLRQFSMSPAFVPTTKQLAAKLTVEMAEGIFQQALRLKTTANVKRFMSDRMREIAPDLVILDTA